MKVCCLGNLQKHLRDLDEAYCEIKSCKKRKYGKPGILVKVLCDFKSSIGDKNTTFWGCVCANWV